ncbi:hypothetical protein TVAG_044370 [Trichomonas vaginalis G3]|uniref:Uncharacterized protein n=1 Tax=Trichomonas vaginalis (strain ATCC PRA-98 / G3) TaxID=412133 RepID=A2E0J5_TRIV3|nr:hypothetical protein TVAGG3_0549920 [Trichomonas vaginalis G3]EAY13875.1 hypothetical protein TVAG_044370 [Trichomonas vaginalis G3]KAI5520423.1 hypothetical protein TVAGG3_0549920 [Trichomonas vaginalis G3]|eukprot:XP_001326098.1 hypothetical protein [Trichomonas vaginalis G3]
MYYNILLPSSKVWKKYWINFNGQFLDICVDEMTAPFAVLHLGIHKIRPTQSFPYPNVFEFYEEIKITDSSVFFYSYDIMDTFDFFKKTHDAFVKWKMFIANEKSPKSYICDLTKQKNRIMKSSVQCSVQPEKVILGKGSKELKSFPYDGTQLFSPTYDLEKPSLLIGPDKEEYRANTIEDFKDLLEAIYFNIRFASNHKIQPQIA